MSLCGVLLCVYLSIFNIKADPVAINLKLETNDTNIFCYQNATNLNKHRITVEKGYPLKINVNFKDHVDHIECVDKTNSKVLVWDSRKQSRSKMEVPQVTSSMNGDWSCTILAYKDVAELSPAVYFEDTYYSAAQCVFRVIVPQEDIKQMNLKLSYNKNHIYCEQSIKNLQKHEITISEGRQLIIDVDYIKYINSIQCADQFDAKRVFLWNPPAKFLRKQVTVPISTRMNGIWNCTILTHRNTAGLSPMVFVNGSHYIASYCAFRVNVRQICPTKMKLKISYFNNSPYCDQNITNIDNKQVTVQEGVPLKITVDIPRYINSIQCTDQLNPSRVYVWNPPPRDSRKQVTVPQITADMEGVWNCTILLHRDTVGLAPMVMVNNTRFIASYCAFRVNVRQSCKD